MRDANIFSSFSVFVLVQHKYHSGTGSLPSVCSAVDSGIGKGGRAVLLWEGAWSFGILRTTPLVLAQHAAVLTTRRYSRKESAGWRKGTASSIHIFATTRVARTTLRKSLVFENLVAHCATLTSKHHSITTGQCCRARKTFSTCR